MDFKHLLALASACAFFINPAHAQTAKPADKPNAPLDVGFVYVSPVTEAGWTFQHDQGRKAMEKALGAKVKTRFVDKVAEGADAERVIRDMAATGSKLIFTTSFGFMEPTLKVAKEFPNTQFVHVSGYKTAANVGNVNARFYEGRYLAGYLAGKSSKSGVAGYVAAFPIPEVLQGINAFALGMREANAKAQVKVIWTSSWFDPGKEADASKTLIGQGADVLTHHTDSGAVAKTAESMSVKVIAYHSDMKALAPKAQLAAVTHHWDAYYVKATQQALAGSWKTSSEWNGMATGAVKLSSIALSVPKDVVKTLVTYEKSIKDGKKAVFVGDLKDNTGKVQHTGSAMTDTQLSNMNYLLEGVVGSIPK
jgi:simple sugar transport system substrate-binding protein